jgi:lysozyme
MDIKSAVIALWMAIAQAPASEQLSAECFKTCQASDTAYAVIQHFEGYSPFVYKDAAGLDTIGFGHLIQPGHENTFPVPLLPEEAQKLLAQDVRYSVKSVNRLIKIPVRQHNADALISFTFNLGPGALSKSTLLKRVNAGRHDQVPDEIRKWVYAGGKKLRGLEIRREAEAALYQGID